MPFSGNTRGIARVVKPTADGLGEKHVGMAFLVGPRHVMTCCHVLNDVLGRPDRLDPTTPPPDRRFSVRFPYAGNAKGSGRVVRWGLGLPQARDVAVLQLSEDAPAGAGVAHFSEVEVQREKWSCIGWDADGVDREAEGILGAVLARGERQLNGPTGVAVTITGGYSGAGVWSDAAGAFVGMVVTRDREHFENKLAYAIPAGVLREVWPELPIREGRSSSPDPADPHYRHVPPRDVDPAALAAAERQLAELPLGRVPGVAPLPPRSRVALRPNPLFVGREEELKALAAALAGGQTAAVSGMGGVGKTQLAGEFVHRYGRYFAGGVYWLSFADGGAVRGEVAACGGVGHLDLRPDFADLRLDDQVQAVLGAWASPLPRLLVFDNCEDPALLDRWRPPTGGCRVLLTTRRPAWPATFAVRQVPLGVLSPTQSVTLLLHHRPDAAGVPADLAAIAAGLGDLPLALHLAGSVLAQYRDVLTPAAYLARLRQPGPLDGRWLRSDEPSPTGHVQRVAATFALSYERLDPSTPTDALALSLLARSAHLAPGEPIPQDLLFATAGLPDGDPDSPLRAADALARLVALGLLERGAAGTLRLHRLLAVYVREREAGTQARDAVEQTLLETAARRGGDPSVWPLLALQPQLRGVTDAASERRDERAAGLCVVQGDHLMRLGDYLGAKSYYDKALAIRRERLGDRHPDTVAAIERVGLAHKERGEYAEARGCFEQALRLNQSIRGERHPDTVSSLNNLAFVLKDQGRYDEALRHFGRALRATRALRGARHPETAVCLNNLGLVHKDRRESAKALRYFGRALKIGRAAHGDGHPGTVPSLNNLAFVLKDQGEYAEAKGYFERALAINEATWGECHPDTIASLYNLAFLLLDQAFAARARAPANRGEVEGLFAESRRCLERALATLEKMYHEGHPRTAEGLDSLGELLSRQGDSEGARRYFERALRIRQQALGEWHPDTARSLANLGRAFAARAGGLWSDDLAQARSYLTRAVAVFERCLGPTPNSPDADRARSALRDVEARLREQNDWISEHMRASLG